jgi:hypothetical protein
MQLFPTSFYNIRINQIQRKKKAIHRAPYMNSSLGNDFAGSSFFQLSNLGVVYGPGQDTG